MEDKKLAAIITPQYMFGNAPLEKYILISECTRAKLENDNKGVNVKRGLAGKVRKGWRPGVAKIGYLNDTSRDHGERGILPDSERFDKVKRLLELFLTGNYSVRKLHRLANERLLLRTRRTKRQGGRPLSLSSVYYLLSDPFYCGKFWWNNEHTEEKELHQGKHPPMITEDEFWQIQALLGKGSSPQYKKHAFAYTSLMTCGDCGAARRRPPESCRYGGSHAISCRQGTGRQDREREESAGCRVLIHVDTELSAKCPLNSRMAYVSVSRARHDGQLFTNDRETLNTALGNDVPTKVRIGRKRRTTSSRAAVLLIKGHAGSGPHCDVCSSFFRRAN
jgi:hypothetical protein